MCNGYFYFDLMTQFFSKDWAYLAEFVVQDAMYVWFDLGAEMDVIQTALGRDDMSTEEVEEVATDFEDETNFQVDTEGDFVADEEEEMATKIGPIDYFTIGQSMGRIVGRFFSSSVDIGA